MYNLICDLISSFIIASQINFMIIIRLNNISNSTSFENKLINNIKKLVKLTINFVSITF